MISKNQQILIFIFWEGSSTYYLKKDSLDAPTFSVPYIWEASRTAGHSSSVQLEIRNNCLVICPGSIRTLGSATVKNQTQAAIVTTDVNSKTGVLTYRV